MESGNKLKFTKKSISFHTDNLWKRQVTPTHLPLFAVVLNREYQPVVTKVTKKYVYQNVGRTSRLSFSVVGFAVEVWWHLHEPEQQKIRYN